MVVKQQVIDAVIKGILNANDFFEKISSGSWLSDAGVENVLQTKIAESIFDVLPKDKNDYLTDAYISVEHHLGDLISESGSKKKRGKVPSLVGGAKRVDLLICDKSERPLIPIEIKRNAATEGFAADAAKILALLGRSDSSVGGSVKYGLICGFISGEGDSEEEAKEALRRKVQTCRSYVERKIGINPSDFHYKFDDPKEYEGSEYWAGGAICLYLRRKAIE